MIRILNLVQGGFGLVILFGSLFGIPFTVVGGCLVFDILVALFIVVYMKESSPKGPAREYIEMVISILAATFGSWYLFSAKGFTWSSSVPQWFFFIALPLVLINLGVYIALMLRIITAVILYVTKFLEFCSGESFGRSHGQNA